VIAAYERAFGDRCEPVQQAMLARKIGEALFRRGQHEQALEHFLRAFNVLGRPLPTSAWGIRLAILGQLVCQVAHRLFPRSLTSRREERLDPVMEEWFRTHAMIGGGVLPSPRSGDGRADPSSSGAGALLPGHGRARGRAG